MKWNWKKLFKKLEEHDIEDATEAYQKSTYSKQYTRDQLKDKLIKDIQKDIKNDVRFGNTYLNITTYSGYREKQVLPDVAEYFRKKNYMVDLHNDQNYSEINVLIINWQNLETFS